MNIAAKELQGGKLILNPNLDVNETASIVLAAKRGVISDSESGKSAIFHPRRRQPEKLRAPNRTANSGSPRH